MQPTRFNFKYRIWTSDHTRNDLCAQIQELSLEHICVHTYASTHNLSFSSSISSHCTNLGFVTDRLIFYLFKEQSSLDFIQMISVWLVYGYIRPKQCIQSLVEDLTQKDAMSHSSQLRFTWCPRFRLRQLDIWQLFVSSPLTNEYCTVFNTICFL